MTSLVLEIVFWLSCLAIVTPNLIYPVSLALFARMFGRSHAVDETLTPETTLIISAYNEEKVIGKKLDNTLALDYPHQHLKVMVISDQSDDQTDAIVESYRDRGISLRRLEERRGKSFGLTHFFPHVNGEIVVFSDANSIYDPRALRRLMRHFADPSVGYVVGHQKYADENLSPVGESESLYWSYEVLLKRCESKLSSVVGGDGAIYAIRTRLFEPLREDDINDFVNPLQIVAQGYRGIFDEEAVCYENTATSFQGEFRRKVRIVNRSLRAIGRVPSTMMPWRVGWFAYQLLFHKLLRWLIPFFLLSLGMSNTLLVLCHSVHPVYLLALIAQLCFYAAAAMGLAPYARKFKPVYLSYYFVVVNAASLIGVLRAFTGKNYVVWQPERR